MLEIDDGALGWIVNTAKKNYWRVAAWYDLDDLIQDGILKYYHCANHYSHITSRPHLMQLFKTTYLRHIIDLSNYRTNLPEVLAEDLVPEGDDKPDTIWDLIISLEDRSEELISIQTFAPEPVRRALDLLLSEEGRRKLRRPYRRRLDGTRETFNERLCRLVGYDSKLINVPAWIRNHVQAT